MCKCPGPVDRCPVGAPWMTRQCAGATRARPNDVHGSGSARVMNVPTCPHTYSQFACERRFTRNNDQLWRMVDYGLPSTGNSHGCTGRGVVTTRLLRGDYFIGIEGLDSNSVGAYQLHVTCPNTPSPTGSPIRAPTTASPIQTPTNHPVMPTTTAPRTNPTTQTPTTVSPTFQSAPPMTRNPTPATGSPPTLPITTAPPTDRPGSFPTFGAEACAAFVNHCDVVSTYCVVNASAPTGRSCVCRAGYERGDGAEHVCHQTTPSPTGFAARGVAGSTGGSGNDNSNEKYMFGFWIVVGVLAVVIVVGIIVWVSRSKSHPAPMVVVNPSNVEPRSTYSNPMYSAWADPTVAGLKPAGPSTRQDYITVGGAPTPDSGPKPVPRPGPKPNPAMTVEC
jgi:hypothetical protein